MYEIDISHLNYKREKKWLRWKRVEYTVVKQTRYWGDTSKEAKARWYEQRNRIVGQDFLNIDDAGLQRSIADMEALNAAKREHTIFVFNDRNAALMYKLARC